MSMMKRHAEMIAHFESDEGLSREEASRKALEVMTARTTERDLPARNRQE